MEINQLYPFVLLVVLVGMVLGVGILTMDRFGEAAKSTYWYNETITPLSDDWVALTYGNITVVNQVVNVTGGFVLAGTEYVVNMSNGRFNLTENTTAVGNVGSVYIEYDFISSDTPTHAAMNSVTTELGNISSQWLGLIITVSVLAIILTLVIGSFSMRGKR